VKVVDSTTFKVSTTIAAAGAFSDVVKYWTTKYIDYPFRGDCRARRNEVSCPICVYPDGYSCLDYQGTSRRLISLFSEFVLMFFFYNLVASY
jgi:hypothetical protein